MYLDDQFFSKKSDTYIDEHRENYVLIGDNLGDNFIAEKKGTLNHISFCIIDQNLTESNPFYKQNDRIKERLKTNEFDIVIKDDANLDLIPLLIHYCCDSHQDYLQAMDEPARTFYTKVLLYLDSDDQRPFDSYFRQECRVGESVGEIRRKQRGDRE